MAGSTEMDDEADGLEMLLGQRAADVRRALDLLVRIEAGEFDVGIVPGRVAGLDTAVVVLQLPGGMVPVFAYVNAEIAAVLRNGRDELPAPVEGAPRSLAS